MAAAVCSTHWATKEAPGWRPPAGTSLSPGPPPHLPGMRSSWRAREDWQLLLGLPKSKALLPTSATWDCQVGCTCIRLHVRDTAEQVMLMETETRWLPFTRAPRYSFDCKIIPNMTHPTALPRKHYLNSKTYHRFIKGPSRKKRDSVSNY